MSHTASTNGAKHDYQRSEKMIFIRFWEDKPSEKSEDLPLSPSLYSFKKETYESRFGVDVQFKHRGNLPFSNDVIERLKERKLI